MWNTTASRIPSFSWLNFVPVQFSRVHIEAEIVDQKLQKGIDDWVTLFVEYWPTRLEDLN
ncbi:hypothetical protein DPV78_002003 [Talaromyces pinophilus]|nr:hypothetical protein DPV78_002003 [Talaromyces pinophilus]